MYNQKILRYKFSFLATCHPDTLHLIFGISNAETSASATECQTVLYAEG